ncbi:SIR2 family protein [Rhizobium sp. AB2/73]|uniref:SIR2 family protein n=1 Tax=Rhizobium TaxID=379 RepID=UPI000DDF190D|nr:SIR2 family protein [Rhizobium sp. AB2/73]QYA15925.1 SIR2 family protein [Rhizobium sp. AB2/73]UEQ84468.1 SIR2 family protein [Rhizobium sp. AB2/73]
MLIKAVEVAMALAPSAATITISQTLALLDGPFRSFAVGVAEDRYAFWLGSGISFGRVDGLKQVIPRVIEFLRMRIDLGNPACRFNAALAQALGLAQLSPEEQARVDLARPFAEWPDADAITGRLIGNYARLLETTVEGEADDFVLWNAVDIASTFADPGLEPDVEHLCIAILLLEGVSSDIASANWDGLVEKAVETLTGGAPALVVNVRPEDLREPQQRARLFKFHGCAVKATADEATYRSCLVGRQSQIHGWVARQDNAPIVQRLIDLITTKPTLMMGLSAQDANIQAIFAAAEARMAWPWPGDRPSYVFSENAIGVDQQGLLRNVYRAAYTPGTRQQILDGALIRAYAKSLLVSLVLHVLCAKLRRLIELAPGLLGPADRERLQAGVFAVRDRLAASAEPDRMAFIRSLIDQSSRAIMMFRDGHAPTAARPYNPISPVPIQQFPGDMTLPASGLREAAVAAGILGLGIDEGAWALDGVDAADETSGIVRVTSAAGSAKVFLVANSYAALRLQHHGHLVDDEDAIVIYSLETTPALPRSPRGAPGRTGRLGLREVSIANLVSTTASSAELVQRFREEVAL